jgi:hypothetical protein
MLGSVTMNGQRRAVGGDLDELDIRHFDAIPVVLSPLMFRKGTQASTKLKLKSVFVQPPRATGTPGAKIFT